MTRALKAAHVVAPKPRSTKLEERARAIVSGIEHGDETHRQWLRDVATPLILTALEEVRRETLLIRPQSKPRQPFD